MTKDYVEGFRLLTNFILERRDEHAKLSALVAAGSVFVMEDPQAIPADKITQLTDRKMALETQLEKVCQAVSIIIPEKQ